MGRKKKGLHYIRHLLEQLSQEEINSVKQYLSCFDPNFDESHKVKTLELLELLLEMDSATEEDEIIARLYPEEGSGGFKFLRLRLLSKIYEGLILEINTERKGLYPEHSRVGLDLRRKLIQARILLNRGITEEIIPLLRKIERKAISGEYYPEVVEVLEISQEVARITSDLPAFEDCARKLDQFHQLRTLLAQATQIHTRLDLVRRTGSQEKQMMEMVEAGIRLLKPGVARHTSFLLAFYHDLFQIEQFLLQHKPDRALNIFQKNLRTIEKHPEHLSQAQLGSFLKRYAETELEAGHFSNALGVARKAETQFPLFHTDQARIREIKFLALFHSGQPGLAGQLFQETSASAESNEFRLRQKLLLASVAFARKDFAACLQTLKEYEAGIPQLPEWNMAQRILSILTRIELEMTDEIELNLDALRKQVNRLIKKGEVRLRYQVVVRILNRLVKQNYHFERLAGLVRDDLNGLAQPEGELAWHPGGPELIPFHNWFLEKIQTENPNPA
ncbi:MAG: hypothetical protein H6581_30860 [Bacteroidia bacterium]|nr:hypothetical protein [Bacteroidia bacterium]